MLKAFQVILDIELTDTLSKLYEGDRVLEIFSGKVASDIGSREVHIMGDLK